MLLRKLFILVAVTVAACFASAPATTIRGRLTQPEGKAPALELTGHKLIALDGDEATHGILNDKDVEKQKAALPDLTDQSEAATLPQPAIGGREDS